MSKDQASMGEHGDGYAVTSKSEAVNTQFGEYQLERRLGEGGMAVTYVAREKISDFGERLVAIKQILPQFAKDKKFRQMFHDEVRITSLLSHKNICRIYRAGEINGTLFMSMEFVDGIAVADLRDLVQGRNEFFPPEHALYIASEVMEGLQAAHTQRDADGQALDLVHRDVSPQNVLVSRKGEVKVIDFGVAKAASNMSQTQTGTVKGKILYLSPEQLQGKKLDGRSDVYAGALMLYELLTGVHPFQGPDEHSTIFNFCTKEAPPPSQLAPHLPAQLDGVIMRGLAREREERYSSAGEFARALTDVLHDVVPGYRNYHFVDFITWALEGDGPVPRQSEQPAGQMTGAPVSQHTGPGMAPASGQQAWQSNSNPQPGHQPGQQGWQNNSNPQHGQAQNPGWQSNSNPQHGQGQSGYGGGSGAHGQHTGGDWGANSQPGAGGSGVHVAGANARGNSSGGKKSNVPLIAAIVILGLLVVGAAVGVGVMIGGGDDDTKLAEKSDEDEAEGASADDGPESGEAAEASDDDQDEAGDDDNVAGLTGDPDSTTGGDDSDPSADPSDDPDYDPSSSWGYSNNANGDDNVGDDNPDDNAGDDDSGTGSDPPSTGSGRDSSKAIAAEIELPPDIQQQLDTMISVMPEIKGTRIEDMYTILMYGQIDTAVYLEQFSRFCQTLRRDPWDDKERKILEQYFGGQDPCAGFNSMRTY